MKYSGALIEPLKAIAGIPRWVFWKYEPRKDNPAQMAKTPKNPHTGGNAKSNEPSTWADFDMAHEGFEKFGGNGFGFELGGGYAGIDIDGCIDDSGQISDMAGKIIERMNSYTEKSPSGRGIHILCRVDDGFSLDGETGKNDRERGLEIYCDKHYFTVTGNVYGEEKPIENRTQELLVVYREYFVKPRQERAKKQPENVSMWKNVRRVAGNETDNELLDRMFNSKHGREIQALWNGDISGYESQSQADLAFVTYLVYWTGHNAWRVDSMFRQSRLMRPKWDEMHGTQTYGAMTISKAMNTTPIYSPQQDYAYGKEGTADMKNQREKDDSGHDGEAYSDSVKAGGVGYEPHTVLAYLEKSLCSDLERVRVYRNRKTGYSNIDKYNSLFPGLYVIGSVTGNGKTTFCGQMADYLAQAGESVLYFTLEQTELELVTKGLARLTAQEVITKHGANALMKYEHTDAVSSINIRGGRITDAVKSAICKYQTFAGNLRIIECGFDTDIDGIINAVKNFMASHGGVKPVVFVDYLQLVRNPDKRLTGKEAVDENIRAFKKLSAENDLAVILISSLNRQNYLSVVDFESFKESGGIEYTADVIWGLQLLVMNAQVFNTSQDLQTKRKFVQEAKNATPRKIELVGLKNRYGRSNSRYYFDYYAEYDLFIPYERKPEEIDAEMTQAFEIFKAQSDSIGEDKRKIKESK